MRSITRRSKLIIKRCFPMAWEQTSGTHSSTGHFKQLTLFLIQRLTAPICMLRNQKRYTMHTRTVAHTDANGNTTYTIETYWSWDYAGEESKAASTVSFCEATFPISKFELPGTRYIDTIYESGHVRYEYYGIGITHTGTIFTTLSDNTISDSSPFYEGLTIDETVERLEKGVSTVVFWIFWIIGTGVIVFKFYERENEWLEWESI